MVKSKIPYGGSPHVFVGGKKYDLADAGFTKAAATKRLKQYRASAGLRAVSRRYITPDGKVRYNIYVRVYLSDSPRATARRANRAGGK